MSNNDKYDLTYITIDSLSEGVGSSQITPLITRLGKSGMKINLISFEKFKPESQLQDFFESIGVVWNSRPFGSSGVLGGISRLNNLRLAIPKTDLIHARSDIPAVSAIISHQAPVLWDVRSLWADQKIMIQKLSVREAEQMATKLVLNKTQVGGSKKAKIKADPDLRQLQEKLSDQLNLAVEIKQKRRGGEISIKFSQFDELDGFLKRLGID
jgi:hypothetical protein